MHFTVGVIHREGELEEILEIYNENDRHTFNNIEKQMTKRYQTETVDMLRDKDGAYHYSWRVSDEEKEKMEEVTVPFTEVFKTIEDYFEQFMGLEAEDDGEYGYWYNPCGEWDWYQIGGRWKDSLLVKSNVKDVIEGERSRIDSSKPKEAPNGYKWTDGARLKDIEWEKMEELNRDRLEKYWEKEHNNESRLITGIKENESKKDYIERVLPFGTYAVLNDDGWIETDNVGEDYYDYFLKDEIKNRFFTVVDCHI